MAMNVAQLAARRAGNLTPCPCRHHSPRPASPRPPDQAREIIAGIYHEMGIRSSDPEITALVATLPTASDVAARMAALEAADLESVR